MVRSGRKSTDVVAHVELMRDNLTLTAQRVLELGARLDCKHAQENIEDGVHAFCYKGEVLGYKHVYFMLKTCYKHVINML